MNNSFKIKNLKINSKAVFGPMLEFSTLPYRLLMRDYKASLAYTEMIYSYQLLNSIDSDIIKTTKKDNPTAIQLVGDFTNKQETLNAVSFIEDNLDFQIIDLNLGCPSKRVMSSNSGSALLKDIDSILDTIKEIKETTNLPISVKTRLGYEKNEIKDISNKLINTNIDFLTIHARKAIDNYSIKPDERYLRDISKNSPIPICYNGDVDINNFKNYLDFDAFMISRNVLTNPFIFKQIDDFFKYGEIKDITLNDRLEIIKQFIKYESSYPLSFSKFKINILSFIKFIKKSSEIRDLISKANSKQEIISIIYNKLDI